MYSERVKPYSSELLLVPIVMLGPVVDAEYNSHVHDMCMRALAYDAWTPYRTVGQNVFAFPRALVVTLLLVFVCPRYLHGACEQVIRICGRSKTL